MPRPGFHFSGPNRRKCEREACGHSRQAIDQRCYHFSYQYKRISSLATFTLSNKQGVFEVKGLEEGQYQLVISHQGYEAYKNHSALLPLIKTSTWKPVSSKKFISCWM
jgi:hypothetical protein